MTLRNDTIERLAQALYETEPGTNGYRPSWTHTSWADSHQQDRFRDRARRIDTKMAATPGEQS